MKQLPLFSDACDIERQIQAILARRRFCNCSGADGADIDLIRAALIAKSKGGA